MLDYDPYENIPSYVRQQKQREEEEMAKINFMNCWMRMKEEEERMTLLESGQTVYEKSDQEDDDEEQPRVSKS